MLHIEFFSDMNGLTFTGPVLKWSILSHVKYPPRTGFFVRYSNESSIGVSVFI